MPFLRWDPDIITVHEWQQQMNSYGRVIGFHSPSYPFNLAPCAVPSDWTVSRCEEELLAPAGFCLGSWDHLFPHHRILTYAETCDLYAYPKLCDHYFAHKHQIDMCVPHPPFEFECVYYNAPFTPPGSGPLICWKNCWVTWPFNFIEEKGVLSGYGGIFDRALYPSRGNSKIVDSGNEIDEVSESDEDDYKTDDEDEMSQAQHFSYPPLDNLNGLDTRTPYIQGRDFDAQLADQEYPDPHHDMHQGQSRYPSPPHAGNEVPYHAPNAAEVAANGAIEIARDAKSESDAASPGRSKPIPKPDREVTKNEHGRYVCTFEGCQEEVREFARKCEWNKHMDKHDRPYKCTAEGCEKLPGFTYSGGLLRHEREVHNKHGGPRKQLNCPHVNCKRHAGKGFSRQENLNEHLRRVHTSDTADNQNGDDTEEDGGEQVGQKRKRVSGRSEGTDWQEELKMLRSENVELKRRAEAHTAQVNELMHQIQALHSTLATIQPAMTAQPTAQMI